MTFQSIRKTEKRYYTECTTTIIHTISGQSLTRSTKISGILFSCSVPVSTTYEWFAFSATLFFNTISSVDPSGDGERERNEGRGEGVVDGGIGG